MATENIYKEESAFVIIMQREWSGGDAEIVALHAFHCINMPLECVHNTSPCIFTQHSVSCGAVIVHYYRIKYNFSSLP